MLSIPFNNPIVRKGPLRVEALRHAFEDQPSCRHCHFGPRCRHGIIAARDEGP